MARFASRIAAVPLLAFALALSGCTNEPSGQLPTARELQAQVMEVSQAAAAGDLPSALMRLQELEALANEALAREAITAETHASILSAIDLVRQDLEIAIAAAQLPVEPSSAEPPADQEPDDDDWGDEEDDRDDGDDRPGNGNGKGNGNGNNGRGGGNGGDD